MGLFSFLENPKILYFTRIAQILFSLAFLVVICYAGTHRGWWDNVNAPLALGGQALPLQSIVSPC